jgi:hypothetical protein
MNKDIIIVAPELYQNLARKLSHEISKKAGGFNGACWTIKQYEDNEFQLGGVRHVIFIGNVDENKLTKAYLPIIVDKLQNQAGACYGYDGSKALIFGEGKLSQADEFQKLYKGLINTPSVGSILISLTVLSFGFVSVAVVALIAWIFKTLDDNAKRAALLQYQTEAASALFLSEQFDRMIVV